MDVSVIQRGSTAVLTLRGGMVADELGEVRDLVLTRAEAGTLGFVLDLSGVPLIDSAGLELIQTLAGDMGRRGGDLRIASLGDVCRDIFLATRMESIVPIHLTVESALEPNR